METRVARLRVRLRSSWLALQLGACGLLSCAPATAQEMAVKADQAGTASASASGIDRPDSGHHRLTGMQLASPAPALGNVQQRSADIAATVTVVAEKNISSAPASAVTADVPQLSSHASQKWEMLASDRTLNAAIARWSRSAGWQMVWELPVDYAIDAHASISGTFEEAIAAVSRSMEQAEVPMNAIFYDGNKVLRIVVKGRE
ncbi:toxin co-regulated pilus biosynthesis Q family protein [Paraherbaspirillum soli]|uniref:Toxin co-regulated pilus biosynthesis Q family protein n=1 Tax=Paraherbaspirillum soli TaxID=631222 RepID=A0ABW0M8B8_9BURK